MEEYYQKVIHLQDRLRQSEEERLKLEMKFNEMLQVMKEEEETHFKKLRTKYKQFLEEDRRRQQRNDKILEALDRIQNRTMVWEARTEKFKAFRRRYQGHFKHASGGRSHSPLEVEPKHYYQPETTYPKDDIEDDIMEKYLDSISSQKCKDDILQRKTEKPAPETKYSNLGNINSIYWKAPKDAADLEQTDRLKNNKDMENTLKQNSAAAPISKAYDYSDFKMDSPKKSSPAYYDDVTSRKQSIVDSPVRSQDNNDYKFTPSIYQEPPSYRRPSQQQEGLNQTPQQVHKDLELMLKQHKDEPIQKPLPIKVQPRAQMQAIPNQLPPKPIVHQASREGVVLAEKQTPINMEEANLASRRVSVVPKAEIAKTITEILVEKQIQLDTQQEQGKSRKSEFEEKIQPLNNAVGALAQNEPNKIDDLGPTNQPLKKHSDDAYSTGEQLLENDAQTGQYYDETGQQQYDKNGTTLQPQYDESGQPQYHESGQPLQPQYEESGQPLQPQYDESGQPLQPQYDESGQPLQPQYDESGQPLQQQYDENGQPIQQYYHESGQLQSQYYDENGQPYYDNNQALQQYDENGQPIVQYDENGQPLMQYDPNVQVQPQYDENGQPIPQYDPNALIQPQYDPNAQTQPQYDDNGQPLTQYDENGQPLTQYDDNGQPISQYDPNAQTQPQYDDNGQPLTQYDQNGQPLPQYDENGQPISQYDPNAQTQPQYDENGQPLAQYDENGQPIPQYDENGQPLQQYYDENGQPVQYYAEGDGVQQYDENGQPVQQQYAADPQQYYDQGPTVPDQQEGLGQQEDLGQQQEPPLEEQKPNVLDILDTDTESAKQETKISNDSDFDFSNS